MLGLRFTVTQPVFDEESPHSLASESIPLYFAEQKALSLSSANDPAWYLGSDTIVLFEGEALGKPRNEDHALEMLMRLNGRSHRVLTGVALAHKGKITGSEQDETEVVFSHLPYKKLQSYVYSKEPMDKAGAYAIQGLGAQLVERINGCFYNVMGLPIQITLRLLKPILD